MIQELSKRICPQACKDIIVYTGLESLFGQLSLLEMMEDKDAVVCLGKTDAYKEKIEIISVAHLKKKAALEIGDEWEPYRVFLPHQEKGLLKTQTSNEKFLERTHRRYIIIRVDHAHSPRRKK